MIKIGYFVVFFALKFADVTQFNGVTLRRVTMFSSYPAQAQGDFFPYPAFFYPAFSAVTLRKRRVTPCNAYLRALYA